MADQETQPAPRRVVVAEDESLIRLDIVETLRDNGFEVVGEAGDGETAVALATELRPDLVIMDVKMPLLDGISAAERIAKARIAPAVYGPMAGRDTRAAKSFGTLPPSFFLWPLSDGSSRWSSPLPSSASSSRCVRT